MSDTFDNAQDSFFHDYREWCIENKIPASLDGFSVWLSDGDNDPEEPWTIGENDVE